MSKFEEALKNADAALRKLGMEDLITGKVKEEDPPILTFEEENELFKAIQEQIDRGNPDFPPDIMQRLDLGTIQALLGSYLKKGRNWHPIDDGFFSKEPIDKKFKK